jgi:hypothetical protein
MTALGSRRLAVERRSCSRTSCRRSDPSSPPYRTLGRRGALGGS